ncbi:hypothetical protein HMPREF1221_01339 [Treponema socranskii subsp. paredis ATCC 35535]|nr:hypothetical protein HMPREF1221_01339 [Treponema socranskii subsp. paredis ATCC 35535]
MKFFSDYVKDNPFADMDDLAEIIINLKGIANRQIGVIELDHKLDMDEVTEILK